MKKGKNKPNIIFPKKRIKTIMQLDEEIGRMAAIVPVMMAKCVELFGKDLVSLSCGQAEGSKILLPAMLKKAVSDRPECDFLQNIVSGLPDTIPPEAKMEIKDSKPKKKRPRPSSKSIPTSDGKKMAKIEVKAVEKSTKASATVNTIPSTVPSIPISTELQQKTTSSEAVDDDLEDDEDYDS
mmetsp:Transcript_9967/g.14959  ORF Transcript_9967/g.14959 Transcript_9967/m.14959 type:complete len:182 (+) Transcript_9967:129-674(+)